MLASWISYTLFNNVLLTVVFTIAFAGTIFNYLIGDLFVLPQFGNALASIMDGVLAAITAYVILTISNSNYNVTASTIIFVVLVIAFEFFFHMYLFKANIIKLKDRKLGLRNQNKLNYSTEIAKEMHPYKGKKK